MLATHRQNIDQKTLKSRLRSVHLQRCVHLLHRFTREVHSHPEPPAPQQCTGGNIPGNSSTSSAMGIYLASLGMMFVPRPLPFLDPSCWFGN